MCAIHAPVTERAGTKKCEQNKWPIRACARQHFSCTLQLLYKRSDQIQPLLDLPKGTPVVQADSGSDSDSDSRNKNEEIIPVKRLTPTVCTDPPEPGPTISTCTVKQRTFFAPTGADSRNRSRNRKLPALYAYPKGCIPRNFTLAEFYFKTAFP
jgi:hypothetical protein